MTPVTGLTGSIYALIDKCTQKIARRPGSINNPPRIPTVFNYTRCSWGWNYNISSMVDDKVRISGWGRGIRSGDYLFVTSESGEGIRLLVNSIEYKQDPKDMWFADTTVYRDITLELHASDMVRAGLGKRSWKDSGDSEHETV